jgi:hypothetical protein
MTRGLPAGRPGRQIASTSLLGGNEECSWSRSARAPGPLGRRSGAPGPAAAHDGDPTQAYGGAAAAGSEVTPAGSVPFSA